MQPQRISVTASALTNDARAAPRLARQAGFGGLVFDAYATALNLPELSTSGRREFRRMLAAEAQALVAVQCDVGVRGFGPGADVERNLSRLDRAMDVGAELGAGCLCVDLGPLPPAPIRAKPRPAVTPEQAGLIILPTTAPPPPPAEPAPPPPPDPGIVSQVNAALAELCARADRYRVMVALSSSLSSFASLHEVMRGVACPWFGLDLDPVAVLRDAWDADEVFSTLGSLLRHVRARDAVLGADRRTRPAVVGRGAVDWPRLMTSLDEAGYRGFVTVDPTELPDRTPAALTARDYLSEL